MAKITICMGSSCFVRGNEKNLQILEDYLEQNDLDACVELCGTNCVRQCAEGPNLKIDDTIHHNVTKERLIELLEGLKAADQSTRSQTSNES